MPIQGIEDKARASIVCYLITFPLYYSDSCGMTGMVSYYALCKAQVWNPARAGILGEGIK